MNDEHFEKIMRHFKSIDCLTCGATFTDEQYEDALEKAQELLITVQCCKEIYKP